MQPRCSTLYRYILIGLLNTALGLFVIFSASHFVGAFEANLIGYLVVVPVSFFTHRDISFRDKGKRLTSFLRYLPSIAAGYTANLFVLNACLQVTSSYLAQSAAIATHVVVTYLCSKFFVFLKPGDFNVR